MARPPGVQLVGRQRDRKVLERVLQAARDGEGGVLVVYGEPGVGKTALLEYAVEAAPDFRLARAVGIEGEMDFPFAALQRLWSPMLELNDRLPPPQRDALAVAFGLSRGEAPNPFLVGLAILGLMSEAAEKRPLLCVVDDAQWLDRSSAQALAFVARRLLAEKVALLFGVRGPNATLGGLPELQVEGLSARDARTLLESVLAVPLDDLIVERLIVEARGNPLALLELPRGLTPAQLAGGFGLLTELPLSSQIEESFARRLGNLPRDAQRLLLLAAADPVGDPTLIWHAARRLGISESAADTVESEGLLSLSAPVAFRHPLVRSAVYRASAPDVRHEIHRALAEATDEETDPDRRAWHLSQGTSVPDEEIAKELEDSAARAQARGGLAAAAAFLERATALTPEKSRRSGRALAAGRAKLQAGAVDDALRLAATAESGVLSELEQAMSLLLRAQISFLSTRGGDAAPLLLKAADRLRELNPELARETYLEALMAAVFAGRLAAAGATSPEVARAARGAPHARNPRGLDVLLDGLVALFSDGYVAAVPILRQAQRAIGNGMSPAEQLQSMWGANISSAHLWDDEAWEQLSERHLLLIRETGAFARLPIALSQRGQMHVFAGELAQAASLYEAFQEATEITGSNPAPYLGAVLVAMRGREAEVRGFIDTARAEVVERGEGAGLSYLDWAEAVLHNGLGRYWEARAAALRVVDRPELIPVNWALPELIEAAMRTGAPELAANTNRLLTDRTRASGTDWAVGVAARSHALVVDDSHAEDLYAEAIERLGGTRARTDLARAHLLYGEWLRRQRRRVNARKELRTAYDMFTEFGMEAFAERARAELQATGEHARRQTVEALDQLTPRESHVSHLVAQGNTNKEIAAQLFVSESTVEYHLVKVFRKLDVKSRSQLASRLR